MRAHHSRQGYRHQFFRPLLYARECPAKNKRTGSVDGRGPIFSYLVPGYVPGTVKFVFRHLFHVPAYLCGVGTIDGGWSFGSAEDPSDSAARRLQDLHCRLGGSRQVLSRGRRLHATVSSAL